MGICFFDIDDTLIPLGCNDIRQEEKEVLNKLKENGHYIFINSGRVHSFTQKYILDFPFSGYALGCGTYIEINHEVKKEFIFDTYMHDLLIQKIKEYQIPVVFEGQKETAFFGNNPTINNLYNTSIKQGTSIGDIDNPKFEFSKFCIFVEDPSQKPIDFINEFKDTLDFIERSNTFWEVVPKNYSKGHAVKEIADLLNISIADCYCFGDSTNDLSMLQAVKHSIVMGNAANKVKEHAEFVTHTCNEDGIKYACKHYHLI